MNKNTSILFQGVGSSYRSKLSNDTLNKQFINQDLYGRVHHQLSIDLSAFVHENIGRESTSYQFYDWILIYTTDVAMYQKTFCDNQLPASVMGYSMGLITALTCLGSLRFIDGLQLLEKIFYPVDGRHTDDECMYVIIGLRASQIQDAIDSLALANTTIASTNNEKLIIVSGLTSEVTTLSDELFRMGAMYIKPIEVPFAMHTTLAKDKLHRMYDFVDQLEMLPSEVPVISSLDNRIMQDVEELKRELKANMYTPMAWQTGVLKMAAQFDGPIFINSIDPGFYKSQQQISRDIHFVDYSQLQQLNTTVAKEKV